VQAGRFVVLFQAEGTYRKLFSLQFERRDNGLGFYVHLPYFSHTRGVLGNFQIEHSDGPTQMSLQTNGTTTTEKLKYTHHPDGRAHFSQDGKALTEVKTQTAPLALHRGHLFTVNFWGVEDFALVESRDLKGPKPDRTPIRFDPEDLALPASQYAGRILGTAYTVPLQGIQVNAKAASRGKIVEPVSYKRWDGSFGHGIPVFPTLHQADEFFIMLTYLPMDRASGHSDPSLTLTGGFHEPSGKTGPLTGIMIHYTDRDPAGWDALVKSRGTIDLPPGLHGVT
jgi:hypothetical protein